MASSTHSHQEWCEWARQTEAEVKRLREALRTLLAHPRSAKAHAAAYEVLGTNPIREARERS